MNTNESETVNADVKIEDEKQHLEGEHLIPKSKLDFEIGRRKESELMLQTIAEDFVKSVPESMRDLIPNLPPADKINWIRSATERGLLTEIKESGPDSKRPGNKQPTDLNSLSPFELRRMGYKK